MKQETRIKNQELRKRGDGFTLIELLVVISIIGVLLAAGVARYWTAERQARDARRQSDLSQYRTALENYAAANGSLYPQPACGAITNLCGLGTFQTTYLSGACIEDPRAASNGNYSYCSNTLQYAIYAKLEQGDNDFFIVCSTGRSGKKTYVSPATPSITGGACPL